MHFCMNQKGFALIEFLAVIVALAINALAGVSENLNTIESSKEEAVESSAYIYINEVETKIALDMINSGNLYKPGKYTAATLQKDLDLQLKEIPPTEGVVCIFDNGMIKEASLKIDDYIVHYDGNTAIITNLSEVEDIICSNR